MVIFCCMGIIKKTAKIYDNMPKIATIWSAQPLIFYERKHFFFLWGRGKKWISQSFDLPKYEEETAIFLQDKKILHRWRFCKMNHEIMWPITMHENDTATLNFVGGGKKKSERSRIWFEGSNINFHTAIKFICSWSH